MAPSPDVPSRLEKVIERDGRDCVWCGRELWLEDLTVEHLLPRSRGGRSDIENLLVACRHCNRRRRSQSAVAYLREHLAEGHHPRVDLISAGLARLSASQRRAHSEYGTAQLRAVSRL